MSLIGLDTIRIDGGTQPRDGVVYFVQAGEGGPIKIGKTTSALTVLRRVAQLQTGCPTKLRLLGVWIGGSESEMHRLFAKYRLNGEWFAPCQELVELARRLPTVRRRTRVD